MSRTIEDYICASEDRSHYNNERFNSYGYWSFYPTVPIYYQLQPCRDYPNPGPNPQPSPPTNITIIQQTISKQEINEIIDEQIPRIADSISDKIGDIINNSDLDSSIDEIYGGSASDMIEKT